MSLQKFRHIPHALKKGGEADARSQCGAICYRLEKGKARILLITSRGTGRWVIPKGWPMDGKTAAEAAEIEAWEEAGVEGRLHPVCLGIYSYLKTLDHGTPLPCVVSVYALRVKTLAHNFPEQGQRKRKWVSPKRAAQMVHEPELSHLLQRFDPSGLPV